MSRKKAYQNDEQEARIVTLARAFFSKLGFEGMRIDALAKALAMNKRILYTQIQSKEALYLRVLSELSRSMSSALETRLKATPSGCPWQSLAFLYIEILLSYPDYLRLLRWERLNESLAGARILENHKALSLAIWEHCRRSDDGSPWLKSMEDLQLRLALCEGLAFEALELREGLALLEQPWLEGERERLEALL